MNSELPAWIAAGLSASGVVAMALYQHTLQIRLKRLEHQLQSERMKYEKQLAFVQERHRKRTETLDSLNGMLMEFDHAVRHVSDGNVGYVAAINDFSTKARGLARASESLLGPEIYEVVLEYTDRGRSILDAQFIVNERAVKVLEIKGLPAEQLAEVRGLIGTGADVRDGGRLLTATWSDDLRSKYHRYLVSTCQISGDFDDIAYDQAKDRFRALAGHIFRTLPEPQRESAA